MGTHTTQTVSKHVWVCRCYLQKYPHYLKPLNIESFFVTPTDNIEVSNIISSLHQSKSDETNSTSTRIFKLLKKDKSDQLAFLLNQSFASKILLPVLKTSKIIPIYKKGSVLEWSNYRPISLLLCIRLMYNRLYSFIEKKDSHIHPNLIFVNFSCSHSFNI